MALIGPTYHDLSFDGLQGSEYVHSVLLGDLVQWVDVDRSHDDCVDVKVVRKKW